MILTSADRTDSGETVTMKESLQTAYGLEAMKVPDLEGSGRDLLGCDMKGSEARHRRPLEKTLLEARRAQMIREAVHTLLEVKRFGPESQLSIGEIAQISRTLRRIQG